MTARLSVAVVLVLLIAFAGAPKVSAAPSLQVKNDRIINKKNGKRFVPRGVNWPSFEYACVDGWGYSHNATGSKAVKVMKKWGINAVRIPLNQDCWLGDDGLPNRKEKRLTARGYRKAVVRFIRNLNRQNIVAIPVLHWSGGRGLKATGLRAMPDERSVAFWRSVAKTFRTKKAVMFDVFNEPYSRWDDSKWRWAFELSWSCWAQGGCTLPTSTDQQSVSNGTFQAVGMSRIVAAIRKAKAKQPIILSGTDYANNLSGWLQHAPNDRQLIAGFHTYTHQICHTPDCWSRTTEGFVGKVPVLTSEVGQNDCKADHIRRFVNWADRRNIGYLVWAWWAIPSGCADYALIQTWSGKPQHAYGRFYRSHLQKHARR